MKSSLRWNLTVIMSGTFYFMLATEFSKLAGAESQTFDTSTAGLPEVLTSQEVILKDGDTYVMTAAPAKQKVNGKWIRRLAYNRMIPGPLLRGDQGTTVKVLLKNNLSLPTTLHPHGLRGETKFDGIPGIGQPPINPGESYEYSLTFKDFGMFWYHPHIRDDYTSDLGLYGAIIVKPKIAATWNHVDQEIPLILDDIDLSKRGTTYYKDKTTHTLMGRFGTTHLVNDTVLPTIKATAGSMVRFYVLNAANTRTFRFAISDVPLTLVGGDHGNMQRQEAVTAVSIGPGERYVIEAKVPLKPARYEVMNRKPKNPKQMAILEVTSTGNAAHVPTPPPANAPQPAFSEEELLRYRAKALGPADYSLELTVKMDHGKLPMVMGGSHHGSEDVLGNNPTFYYLGRTSGVEWDDGMAAMNLKSTDETVTWQMVDVATKKANMAINWTLKKGELYLIKIKNSPNSMHPMQHPIHFHGQRFLVVGVNGVPNPNYVWKDTVLVGAGDQIDLLLEASNPGRWMGHCHILEHIGAGMMMGFSVTEAYTSQQFEQPLAAMGVRRHPAFVLPGDH